MRQEILKSRFGCNNYEILIKLWRIRSGVLYSRSSFPIPFYIGRERRTVWEVRYILNLAYTCTQLYRKYFSLFLILFMSKTPTPHRVKLAPHMRCSPNTEYFLNVRHVPSTLKTHTNVWQMSCPHYFLFGERPMYKCLTTNNVCADGTRVLTVPFIRRAVEIKQMKIYLLLRQYQRNGLYIRECSEKNDSCFWYNFKYTSVPWVGLEVYDFYILNR